MWHPIKHYKTIHHHKMLVMKNCFRCGLYWQGLTHDLSKLAPVEFWAGAKYWQGTCSPNNAQRQAEGYSAAWLHHKGRNKHHLEYWIDYSTNKSGLGGMKMPLRYVCEMVCDRVAARTIRATSTPTQRRGSTMTAAGTTTSCTPRPARSWRPAC